MVSKHGKIIKMTKNKGLLIRSLDRIEVIANKLPDPFFIFLFLSIVILIISYITSSIGVSVIHPGTGDEVTAVNLLSKEFFVKMHTDLVKNFVGFPPLGYVLVALIGISVADHSGFINTLLKWFTLVMPNSLLTASLIFASINSSLLGDAGLVLMPALGAALFHSMGRNPIAGLVAAFAGVCGGFSANILLTSLDPLLSSFTDPAAKILNPDYNVYATANYYFMIVSTFIITAVGTFVNAKFVEPRLGKISVSNEIEINDDKISKRDKKALFYSVLTFFIIFILILLTIIPENGLMRSPEGDYRPFYQSIITFIVVIFLIPSVVYGYIAGTIKKINDISSMMSKTFSTMGPYILLAFAAGQFVAYFTWSNLGIITAVKGAEFLQNIGLQGIWLLIGFLTFSTILNVFIYSASAKWALFAPVFVPMFMILGISPEMTQLVYRVGDSITNMITPLLPYFPIVLAFAKKYDKDITFGKLVSSLIPYSIGFYIIWTVFLILWYLFALPIGPSAEIMIN